jgi:hypothetical protein
MTTRRVSAPAVALVLVLVASGQLRGQAIPTRALAAAKPDSNAWRSVVVHIVNRFSDEILRISTDTTARPWSIHLPPDEPQAPLIERQLTAILRARPVLSTDSVFRTLTIGPMKIVNDTARVVVSMNETRRCPGTTRTTGWGWRQTVFVRHWVKQKSWGVASAPTLTIGDGVLC